MMTTAHDCKEELRHAELKITQARLGVLAALESAKSPLDVPMILKYLKTHRIGADKVTVFRIIHTLTDKGLAKPIQFNEGKMRYEYAVQPSHHHFVCEQCGTVIDIEGCHIKSMEREIAKEKGILVKRHSLEFFGLCGQCKTV